MCKTYDDFYKTNYTELINLDFGMNHIVRSETREQICRFCGKTKPYVSFRKNAHAISELLGNKNIILRDECDKCNQFFGDKYELDLSNFLDPMRTFIGLKGKDGIPKFKKGNFKITGKDSGSLFELSNLNIINKNTFEVEFEKKLLFP